MGIGPYTKYCIALRGPHPDRKNRDGVQGEVGERNGKIEQINGLSTLYYDLGLHMGPLVYKVYYAEFC